MFVVVGILFSSSLLDSEANDGSVVPPSRTKPLASAVLSSHMPSRIRTKPRAKPQASTKTQAPPSKPESVSKVRWWERPDPADVRPLGASETPPANVEPLKSGSQGDGDGDGDLERIEAGEDEDTPVGSVGDVDELSDSDDSTEDVKELESPPKRVQPLDPLGATEAEVAAAVDSLRSIPSTANKVDSPTELQDGVSLGEVGNAPRQDVVGLPGGLGLNTEAEDLETIGGGKQQKQKRKRKKAKGKHLKAVRPLVEDGRAKPQIQPLDPMGALESEVRAAMEGLKQIEKNEAEADALNGLGDDVLTSQLPV